MALLPHRCPACSGEVVSEIAGPRLAFCRRCRRWWTVGGRPLGGGRQRRSPR